ncbi:MAG: DCC1-like thiol-disulfide oxidoreductase family protein, partial [Pseudomonadota bacterium]
MALTTHDDRPLLIYDDACSICRAWVSYWQQLTAEKVRYVPFRDMLDRLPHVSRENLERAIHFLNEDGTLSSGAHAAYKVLRHAPGKGHWLWLYRFVPGFAWLAEGTYAFFLIPNPAIQRIGLWLWRRPPPKPAEYRLVSGLFLRLLALIYLAAFISIGVQILGLSGSEGIFPFAEALRHVQEQQGLERYWFYPTVFWINASDLALQIIPILGCVFAVALFFNRLPRLSLICLFALYL